MRPSDPPRLVSPCRAVCVAVAFWTILFSPLFFTPDDAGAQPLLYLSDFSGNRVAVVDTGAGAVSTSILLGASVSEPHGVAVNADGTRAFITNSGSNNIAVIDTQTDTVLGLAGVGETPYGIGLTLRTSAFTCLTRVAIP